MKEFILEMAKELGMEINLSESILNKIVEDLEESKTNPNKFIINISPGNKDRLYRQFKMNEFYDALKYYDKENTNANQ